MVQGPARGLQHRVLGVVFSAHPNWKLLQCFLSLHSTQNRTSFSLLTPPGFPTTSHLSPGKEQFPEQKSLLSSSGKPASCEQFFLAASGHLHPVLLRLMCKNKFRVAWGFLTSSQESWGCRARGHILYSKSSV